MKKLGSFAAVACMCSFAVSSAFAGGACCASKKGDAMAKGGEGCAKKCGGYSDSFPTMAMMVGDKSYECPVEAGAAAKAAHSKVNYVVSGEKFDDQEKAWAAYACAAECYAKNFASIGVEQDGKWTYCSPTCNKGTEVKMASACAKDQDKTMSADAFKSAKKFRVAGHTYNNWDDAVRASRRAQETMKQVKMACIVDGKTIESCDKICPTAMKEGKVQFVVGEQKTQCPYDAKVKLAKAQVEACKKAVDSMAKA